MNSSTLAATSSTANDAPVKVFAVFMYDDIPCEENLWWVFILSCLSFPTSLLLCLGIWRGIRMLLQRKPRGYQRVHPLNHHGSLSVHSNPRLSRARGSDAFFVPDEGGFPSNGVHGKTSVVEAPILLPQTPADPDVVPGLHWSTVLQRTASEIVSAQSVTGKITGGFLIKLAEEGYLSEDHVALTNFLLTIAGEMEDGEVTSVLITFIVSMVSLGLYFLEVTNSHIVMIHEKCAPWTTRLDWQLELVCSLCLLVDYFIRFVAAGNKLKFMFEVYSCVDYLTIPPAFLVVFLNHHWTGFRFLRSLYVILIPDLLQYFSILTKSAHIRLAQLCSWLIGVIFVSAGFIHMIETYGDPHLDNSNAVLRSYWEYVYFAVVSMSTVGYGDVVPMTRLGRAFTIVFILVAFFLALFHLCCIATKVRWITPTNVHLLKKWQAVFAACVPELYRFFDSRKRYGDEYHIGRGVRHVVVAANQMPTTAMENFLRMFYHNQAGVTDVQVVFINRVDPDLEMEALLKRNATRVFYIQGSLLQPNDLAKTHINQAVACLFLADKNAANPTAEDARTVMSVISVKNASASTRCLVQILQSRSTTHVRNIPGFGQANGDSVICFSTLGLGLLAQSCLAPGSATMMTNLMSAGCKISDHESDAFKDYALGSQKTFFLEQLSSYFEGRSFIETAKICCLKLRLSLIGVIEPSSERPSGSVLLNPSIIIRTNHVGIFIAESVAEVSKAWYICKECHSDVLRDNESIHFCGCPERRPTAAMVSARDPWERFRNTAMSEHRFLKYRNLPKGWERIMIKLMQAHPSTASLQKYSTVENPLDRVLLPQHLESIEEDAEHDEGGPLRMMDSPRHDDSPGSVLDITKAFYSCSTKAHRSVLLSRGKAAKRQFSDHIVVLVLASPHDPPMGFQDFILPLRSTKIKYDHLKEIVLLGDPVYLEKEWHKIRNLPKICLVRGDPLDRADLRAVAIKSCAMCVILPSRSGGSEDPILDDKDAILATLNIMAMGFERVEARSRSASIMSPGLAYRRAAREGFEVPTISALYQDANVPLLDTYDPDVKVNNHEVIMMEPYVCGYALPLSCLDSILVANFFNPYALELIKALLFGDMSVLTETFLAEGIGLVSGDEPAVEAGRSGNSQLRLIGLMDPPLCNRVPGGWTYGTLFSEAAAHGILCLGLARRAYPEAGGSRAMKRCVITSPSPGYQLRQDDLVYVLSS